MLLKENYLETGYIVMHRYYPERLASTLKICQQAASYRVLLLGTAVRDAYVTIIGERRLQ